jgi:hypothetical protein
LQTNLRSFQDNERKEAEVRLQSLADNPGVVFQYLIYTDGTDNLKYVGNKGGGICRGSTTEPAVSLGWNSGRWRNEKQKTLLMCRGQNKMDCSMEIYNAKR